MEAMLAPTSRGAHPPVPMSASATPSPRSRIALVDALRGSALAGLFLLHCVEHFDFGHYPPDAPAWLASLNAATSATAFFLFGGKAYAIFALMFGVSFYLILDGAARRGVDYRARFLWRLAILAMLGYLHGLVFCGDFLLIIAVLGLPLVLFYRASTRIIAVVAAVLLLEPPFIVDAIAILRHQFVPPMPRHWGIYGEITTVYAGDSLAATTRTNLWQGQWARIWFTIETGRYLQMSGLFLCGLLLGRSEVLTDLARARRFGRRLLLGGIAAFAVLYPVHLWLRGLPLPEFGRYRIGELTGGYVNLAQMAVWIGGFVLLYGVARVRRVLDWLAPYGRTSLTNYVTQALFWVPFYYGWGLAMHRYMGTFFSVLAGVPFLAVQIAVSRAWLRHFHYGPLEWVWRAGTKLSLATPLRRAEPVPA